MEWELFDPQEELRITAGRLPHWFQPGRLYFITFRTDDSLPARVAQLWREQRRDWLRRHGINPCAVNWKTRLAALPAAMCQQFHEKFSKRFLKALDRGYGACVLRRAEVAAIVMEALQRFDRQRHELTDLVVMPNHVHLLVGLLGKTDLACQCYSWKRNSALRINQLLHRRGRFWHEESFDHLVRTMEQFQGIRRYIAENPTKARLRPGEYVAWQRKDAATPG